MGVIDRQPVIGQSNDEDKLYTFSSKPSIPGERCPDILVRFQAVSRTQPSITHQYCKLSSKTRLSTVRQCINQFFKNYFNDGFIFLSKTKEILRSKERCLTLFDILPKVPSIYNNRKDREVPNDAFLYPDVQYKKVGYEFEGRRYLVMCACVVFLYEASKVSHWPPEVLHEDLSANTIEGFCFIPTDIMSWKDKIIESRASSLHLHAACGTKKELELSIHQLPGKININHLKDQRGASPLHYAAENGHIDACEILIAGIGKELIFQRDSCDKTPLHCALYRRKVKTITYLLQLNSDLSYADSYGNSCFDLLLKQSDKDLEFIIYKLQIDCIVDLLRFQLAWCSISKGNRPLSRYLAKHLTRFDFDLDWGQSILHIAVRLRDKDVIDTILSNGVSLRSRDIRGFLPLHIACRYGYTNVHTLIYKEMDNSDLCKGIQLALRSRNFSICSAISQLKEDIIIDEQTFCLVLEVLDLEIRKVHHDKHSEKDLKNFENAAKHLFPLIAKVKMILNTYVFDCAFYGAAECISLLSSLGADFDITDQMGRTPLHESCQRNHINVVDSLIAAKVDPNRTDWRGSTPLHYACANNNLQVVMALMAIPIINAGAQDNCGRTPLLVSVLNKNHEVVQYLIRKHIQTINLHATDVYGHSILHYTVNMTETCVEVLLENILSIEKSESKLRRGLKRWRDTSDYSGWSRQLVMTKFNHKSPITDNNNANDAKSKTPFNYPKESSTWERVQLAEEKQLKHIKTPVTKCVKCDKYVAHKKKKHTRIAGRHVCIRNCKETKLGDDGRKRMKVKPFSFHSFDFSESITPLLQAARAGQTNLMKRLNKFNHSYRETLDAQNRSLLEFAVDQYSTGILKTLFEFKPVVQRGLMHRILMQKGRHRKDTNRKNMMEFLLSKGYSPEEIPEPTEIAHDKGQCAWRKEDRNPRCSRDCHLKAYTVLEVSVRNNEEDIFKLLLDSTTNFQQNFLLNLLAYNGNVWMIESFLKKRTKLKTLKEKESDIDKIDELEIGHVLDIACCSKKLSTVLIQSLVKVTPDIFVNAYVADPDEYSVQSRPDMEWNMASEMTTLGKLMSRDHPLVKSKSKDGRERIENTACFLIDSGIQLDDLMNDFDTRWHVHGVCEAFMCAMENGYYRAAVSLLEEAGDVFWDCAMNINRCRVQIKFNQQPYSRFIRLPDPQRITENATRFKHTSKELSPFHFSITEAGQFQRFHDLKRDFLKYHILLACEEDVPETVLRELLIAGREFFDSVDYPIPDINLDEIHDNSFDEVCNIDNPLCRLLLCVCELMSAYSLFKKRYDVLRILKLAPVLYPYLHLVDRNIFFEPINRGRGSLILQRCVDLAYRKLENRKLKKVQMSDGTTLLHLVSSGDSVDIVKSILKAETQIDIDSMAENGLRPVDVAAACGSWNVYKLLCDSGALVTGQTLVACCATEKFLGIDTWANHIHGFRHSDRGIEKSRVKIVKDICERDGIDLLYEHPEHGTAVENAVKHKYWEVMDFFNKKRWSMVKSSLQNDGIVACILFRDGPDRLLTKILLNIEKNINTISRAALQQIILQSANRNSIAVLNGIVNIICEKHPSHQWNDLLNVKDKYGMGALHYAACHGFYSPIKIWAERMGNIHFKETSRLDAFDAYTRTDSPVYFALTNKHWDVAICLLLNGSKSSFKRYIPDFYTKRRYNFKCAEGKSEPACLSEKHFWTSSPKEKSLLCLGWKEKRLFPQRVNTSSNVLPCISPETSCVTDKDDNASSLSTTKSQYKYERVLISDPHYEKKKYVKHILNLIGVASKNKCSLIHVACATGDIDLVQKLLNTHPNAIEAEDFDGIMPFVYALAGGNTEIVDLMKTDLNQKNAEETLRVLIWRCITKDIENAKRPVLNTNFKQLSTNSKVYVDKRKFQIVFQFLSAFEIDEFGSQTEQTTGEDYGNLLLFEKLREIRDKICTCRIFNRWTSTSFATSEGKGPEIFSDEYTLEQFRYVFKEIDPRKLDVTLLISIIALGRPNVLEELLQTWKGKEESSISIRKPLVGNFSILDFIIIFIESNSDQSKSFEYYLQQYRVIIEELLTADVTLHQEVALIAIKKKLWILFEPVARKMFQNQEAELSPYWLGVLAASVEDGQLSFFRTILDLIGFPKMEEENKCNFIPFLYLASLKGKSDIVKYLLRYNVPISSPATDHMIMLDILGHHYHGSWTILHYAIKSNCSDIIKIILRSCRHDALFLQSISLMELLQLTMGLKDNSIFQILEEYFEEALGSKLTLTELEKLLLFSAKKGYSYFCERLIAKAELSVFTAGLDNMNTLHYASIYDMRAVAEAIMKRTPDVIRLKDKYGLTPVDYAHALGKTSILRILSSNSDLQVKPNEMCFDSFGWLRGLLEANEGESNNSNTLKLRPVVPVDKGLCLEGLLLRADDHAAAFFIDCSRYLLEKSFENNVNSYGKLFHLAARLGCLESIQHLFSIVNEELMPKILSMNHDNMTPMAWAVKMSHVQIMITISEIDKEKLCSTWRAPITEETLLHIAVKTGQQEIVTFVDKWTDGLLRTTKDKSGVIPEVCAVALGYHYLLPYLCEDTIANQHHANKHSGDNVDYTCIECLLDQGIGWSKSLQHYTFRKEDKSFADIARKITPIASNRGMTVVRNFQYHCLALWIGDEKRKMDWKNWFNGKPSSRNFLEYMRKTRKIHKIFSALEWCHFNPDHSFVAALMFSMGYCSDGLSVLIFLHILEQRHHNTCPPMKMLRLGLRANPILDKQHITNDKAVSLFEIAASTGNKTFFENNTDRFNSMSSYINEKFSSIKEKLSLSEIAYGFGHQELGKFLEDELTRFGLHGIFRSLHDLQFALPQKVVWALKLELPGDENWQIEKEIQQQHCRLTKADIWLTTVYPANVLQEIEQDIVPESIIPSKCANKKFNPDVESFSKQSCFSGKSIIWIKCLMASSMIYGHTHEVLHVDESRFTTVSSLRIICIPPGTGDHAKTVIEQTGSYIESVGLHIVQDSVTVQNDNIQHQRSTEAKLRDNIQHKIIPQMQKKILDIFGMKVNIKIDWRSVESQKRTSGSDTILKILSDEAGNSLAGLEDVLLHCEEMKNDITYMFNQNTAKLAIHPISSIREIIIKYVDTLPDLDTVFQRKFTISQKSCMWHFSVERSTLKYDRTTFKFWHFMQLYHGTCLSVLDAVHRIASVNTESKPERKKVDFKPVTLEIDWNSFGVNDPYTTHMLITQKVAREVLAIAHHCEAMFHLKLSGEHVIIQNTTSSKYTGVTPIFKLLTINVYAHQLKNKEWEVSSENAFTKLSELEDKELASTFSDNIWPNITKRLHKMQDNIVLRTGIPARVFIDEKRFLSLMFNKCRRDPVHPKLLIFKSIKNLFNHLPDLYSSVLSFILKSPAATFCSSVSNFNIPSGIWLKVQPSQIYNRNVTHLLILCNGGSKVLNRNAQFRVIHREELHNYTDCILCGPWVMLPLHFCFVDRSIDHHSIKYLSFGQTLYEILDAGTMIDVFSNIQAKFTLHDLLFDHLEGISEVRLTDKLLPNPVRLLTEVCSHPSIITLNDYMKQQPKLQKMLPITIADQITIDWRSFCINAEESHEAERVLMDAIFSFLNTYRQFGEQFNLIESKLPVCCLQEYNRTVLCETLQKLSFRIQKLSIKTNSAEDLPNRNNRLNPEIQLLTDSNVQISYTNGPVKQCFTDNIKATIIRILELETMSKLNGSLERLEETQTSTRRSVHISTASTLAVLKSRPHLDLVLKFHLHLREMVENLKMHSDSSLDHLRLLNDVCYVKSQTQKTTIELDDGILKIKMSPRDISKATFMKEFHKIPELHQRSKELSNGRISFQLYDYSPYFVCRNRNTLTLKAVDSFGNPPDRYLLDAHTNRDTFKIYLWNECLEHGSNLADKRNKNTEAMTKAKDDAVDFESEIPDEEEPMQGSNTIHEGKFKEAARIDTAAEHESNKEESKQSEVKTFIEKEDEELGGETDFNEVSEFSSNKTKLKSIETDDSKIGSRESNGIQRGEITSLVAEILDSIIEHIDLQKHFYTNSYPELINSFQTEGGGNDLMETDVSENVPQKNEATINETEEENPDKNIMEEKENENESSEICSLENILAETDTSQMSYETSIGVLTECKIDEIQLEDQVSIETSTRIHDVEGDKSVMEQDLIISEEKNILSDIEDESDIIIHRITEQLPEQEKTEIIPEEVRTVNDTIQIRWNATDTKFNGKTRIDLVHYGRKLDIPKFIHFFGDSQLEKYSSYLGARYGIKIERDGFMALLLEHDLCTRIKVSKDELDSNVEVCKQKHMPFVSPLFKSDKDPGIQAQFRIFTSPKRYGKGKLLPIKIEPLSVLPEKGTWKWTFVIRSLDPTRQTRIRVVCKLCKHYLKMVTPFCEIDPGKELVINCFRE